MWSCPHCGTPQEETARCWVCRRSTVCCATCRHVRAAVAGGMTYCGLDRLRTPIRGDEIRPCWEMSDKATYSNDRSISVGAGASDPDGFVPILPPVTVAGVSGGGPPPVEAAGGGWTLFPEVES